MATDTNTTATDSATYYLDEDAIAPTEKPTSRRPRRRWAKGADRPNYLKPSDVDKLMFMLITLMSEVSSLRDRIDTHEGVAETGKPVTTAEVEAYQLTEPRRAVREKQRHDMLHRVMRVITEELEAVRENAK